MSRRSGPSLVVAVAWLVAATACSSSAPTTSERALTAAPSDHCATDHGAYDGLRSYLADQAAAAPWIDRVSVCAGGLIEVDQAGMGEGPASAEAIDVCEVAAGYLITRPPPPERADAPNPKEIGVIVADAEGAPVVLGAEDEAAAGDTEAEREQERERERERERDGRSAGEREREPFRCFDPFA